MDELRSKNDSRVTTISTDRASLHSEDEAEVDQPALHRRRWVTWSTPSIISSSSGCAERVARGKTRTLTSSTGVVPSPRPPSPLDAPSVPEAEEQYIQYLAKAVASRAAGPLADAARQAVDAYLREATPQIVAAVHSVQKGVTAPMHEPPPHVFHRAPSNGSHLGSTMSRANSRSNSSVPKRKNTKQHTAHSMSSTSSSQEKDMKALESDLADLMLHDAGLGQGSRPRRRKSGSSSTEACCTLAYEDVHEHDYFSSPEAAASKAGNSHNALAQDRGQEHRLTPGLLQAPVRSSLRPASAESCTARSGGQGITWAPGAPSKQVISLTAQSSRSVTPCDHPENVAQMVEFEDEEMNRIGSLQVEGISGMKVSTKGLTTEEILHVRVAELTGEITPKRAFGGRGTARVVGCDSEGSDRSEESPFSVPLVFKLSGILPWPRSSRITCTLQYSRAVFLLATLALVETLLQVVTAHKEGIWSISPSCEPAEPGFACWAQRGLLSEGPLAACGLVGMVLLGTLRGSEGLSGTIDVLQSYAYQQDLDEQWNSRVRRDAWLIFTIWFVGNLVTIVGTCQDAGWCKPSLMGYLHIASYAVTSSVLTSLTFCMVYVSRALTVMVDLFCCRVVDRPDISDVVNDWNILQALLRKASITIELCFVALQAGAAFALPLLIADFWTLGSQAQAVPALIPGGILSLGVLRMFFLAASITDKCLRIPSLINSLSFGPGTARVKQHTVEYIVNSAAGFYVCDIRFTTATAFHFVYGWSVVAFAIGTKVLSLSHT